LDHWESNRGSHARNALLGCGALWALAAAVLVFAHLLTSRETGDLMTRWDATFGSWGDTLEAWPSRGASLEALDVEQRAADLGIELAPTGSGRNGTRSTAAVALGAVRGPLAGYLVAALENPDRRSVAAPAEVRSYLESARPGLDALYARLRSGDPPRWERHLERNVQAPLPNLLGHVQIQKLMLADAIDAVATGASERSDLALEASWRLNEALRDGPHLIELLVALHITRQQAGAVRLLPAPADVWAERMQSVRYTDKVIRSLALEGRMLVEAIGAKAPPSGGVMAGTAQLLTGPYRRQCAADSGGELLERLERLSKLNHVCDRDLEALGASLSWESPWWNKLGEVAVPSLSAERTSTRSSPPVCCVSIARWAVGAEPPNRSPPSSPPRARRFPGPSGPRRMARCCSGPLGPSLGGRPCRGRRSRRPTGSGSLPRAEVRGQARTRHRAGAHPAAGTGC